MSDKDIALSVQMRVPDGSNINSKPCYLLTLLSPGNKKATSRFLAIDLPDREVAFTKTKGFFTEVEENTILTDYRQIIAETPKEQYTEMYFSNHSVVSIRSLVFKAK